MEETGMLIASGLDTAGQTTFDAAGISREEVPMFLKKVISEGDVVSNMLKPVKNRMGYERIYYYNGEFYLLT